MLPQQIKIPYIKGTVVGFYYDSLGHAKGEVIQVPFQECRISGENPEYIYWFAPDYSIIVLENCKLVYVETKLGIADV